MDVLWSAANGAPFVLQTYSANTSGTSMYIPSSDGQHVVWVDPSGQLKVSPVANPSVQTIAVDGALVAPVLD
jgi:hypothetical protein